MERRPTLVAAGVAGVMMLVALASTAGAPMLRSPQGEAGAPQVGPPPTEARPTPTEATGDARPPEDPGLFELDVRLLLWVVVAALILILVLVFLSRVRDARDPVPQEFATLDLLEEATDEQARTRILQMGDARNAVVAAWVEVERAVSAGGVARAPSETSTDLVSRVVSDLGVDPTPLIDLGARYRAARFSEHPIGPPDVAAAVRLLETVHTELAARPRRPTATGADDSAAADPGRRR